LKISLCRELACPPGRWQRALATMRTGIELKRSGVDPAIVRHQPRSSYRIRYNSLGEIGYWIRLGFQGV